MKINNQYIFLLCLLLEINKNNFTHYKYQINNIRDNETLFEKNFYTLDKDKTKILEENYNLVDKFYLDYFLNYKVLYEEDFPFTDNKMNVLFIHFKELENINDLTTSRNIYIAKTLSFEKSKYSHVLKQNILYIKYNWSFIPAHLKIENEFNNLKTDDINNLINDYNFDVNEFVI